MLMPKTPQSSSQASVLKFKFVNKIAPNPPSGFQSNNSILQKPPGSQRPGTQEGQKRPRNMALSGGPFQISKQTKSHTRVGGNKNLM